MNIIKPAVELWQENDDWIHHVAKCARICYASDGSKDKKLVDNLLKLGHLSMFRHRSIYYIIPKDDKYTELVTRFEFCPYVEYLIGNEAIYLATNGHFYIEHKDNILKTLEPFIVTAEEFSNWEIGWQLMRYTFRVTTQISTSRELNRVSPNNIAEQSTRYVNFGKDDEITICEPYWFENLSEIDKDAAIDCWKDAEQAYIYRVNKLDWKAQDVREFLPLCTATVCVYTYSISQWRNIIDLRYYGTTGAPHPNAKIAAGMIREELIKLGYKFK